MANPNFGEAAYRAAARPIPKAAVAKVVKAPVAKAPAKAVVKPQTLGQSPAQQILNQALKQLTSSQSTVDPLQSQHAAQQQAFQGFTNQLLDYLKGAPTAIQGDYKEAVDTTNNLAQASADRLLASNPNSLNQADLAAIGAPQAQRDALAQSNQNVYGGGSALLYKTAGAMPASLFATDAANAKAFADSLPSIQGLKAQQLFSQLLGNQSGESAKAISDAQDKALKNAQALISLSGQQRGLDQQAITNSLNNKKLTLAQQKQQQAAALAGQKFLLDSARVKDSSSQGWARIGVSKQNSAIAQQRLAQDAFFKQANLGLASKRLQISAAKSQAQLNGGGFTKSQVIQFKKRAGQIATEAFKGKTATQLDANGKKVQGTIHLTYQEAMTKGLAAGIPLTVMQAALDTYWKTPGFTASWETPGSGEGRPLQSYQQRHPGANPKNVSYTGGGGDGLVNLLKAAGFKGNGLRIAYGIAMRESGGRPDAFNGNTNTGDRSWGLFQINTLGNLASRVKKFGLQSEQDLLDPLANAKAAYAMSRGGTDFGAWGIGPNAYRTGRDLNTIQPWRGNI